jgi:hypothetical protein
MDPALAEPLFLFPDVEENNREVAIPSLVQAL